MVKMVKSPDIIKRVFEKKDEILKAVNRIMAMDGEYKKNTVELRGEINTISSSLAELKPYASFFQQGKLTNLQDVGDIIIYALDEGIFLTHILDSFCICANSIVIRPTRKSMKVIVGGDLRRLKALLSEGRKKR
jgi:hypothetical protein